MSEQSISAADKIANRRQQPGYDNPREDALQVGPGAGRGAGDLPARRPDGGAPAPLPDQQGGAPSHRATPSDLGANNPLAQMHRLIERAGEEPFADDTIRVLSEPIDDTIVDIRPDGLIFVSHPHYRDRLDRAFGPGAWALVPLATPRVQDNRVLYYGFLKARGQYIGDAVGGSPYYPNNKQGSYDNSVEAAKSDCLVRCCKALPMFRECWDKEYADYWVSTYAEQVYDGQRGGGKVWKKKGEAKRNFDVRPGRLSQGEYHKASRLETENQRHIDAMNAKRPLLEVNNDEYQENPEYQWDREEAE